MMFFALATSGTTPADTLLQYGALGAITVILIYAVKKMYDANTKGYEARLADRDRIIADRDRIIDKQDVTISLLLRQGQNTNTALERTAQVMEVLPKAIPADDLAEVKSVLSRATSVLERLEAPSGGGSQ